MVNDGNCPSFPKVSRLANKGQFEKKNTIRDLPKFKAGNELKQYLVENNSEELGQRCIFYCKELEW